MFRLSDLLSITASWPPREAVKDFFFSKKLKFTNHSGRLTRKLFKQLQETEKQIMPPERLIYSKMKNRRELRKYVLCFDNSQIDCYLDEGCFMLNVRFYNSVELYDIQSSNEHYGSIFKAFDHVAKRYANDVIYAYSREKTTYKMYKILEKKAK